MATSSPELNTQVIAPTVGRRSRPFERTQGSTLAFAGLAVLSFVVLLAAGNGMTFFWDDWAFVTGRGDWSLDTFMRPHNEHWSAGPLLIFKTLLATVGLHSYVPYQVVLVVLHILVAAALFVLVRREAGPYVGLAAATLFLFLGSAGSNLFWVALIGWNLAAAAGAWALVLAMAPDRMSHPWLVAGLLVVAAASSGVGLPFVVAATAVALTTRERRRQLWVVAPAVVTYGIWFLMYGRGAVSGDSFSPANLTEIPAYVAGGIGNALGRLSGWGDTPGMVLAVVLLAATTWRLLGPRPILLGALVGVVGLLAQFGITGLARARLGPEQAAAAHYVYVAAFFLLLALGSWLSELAIDGTRRRQIVVLGLVTLFALGANLAALVFSRASFLAAADDTRAAITVLTRFGGSPAVPADRGIFPLPGSAALAGVLSRHGSPLTDVLAPAPPPTSGALDRALFQAVEADLVPTATALPTTTVAPEVVATVDATAAEVPGCLLVTPVGPTPRLLGRVVGGTGLYLQSTAGGTARLMLSHFGMPLDDAGIDVSLPSGRAVLLQVPDLGASEIWSYRLDPPPAGPTSMCLARAVP